MRAIEIAHCKNWKNLWLESNSTLVVKNFFSSSTLVPWILGNRWLNCLKLTRNINFVVSHVFRQGNQCADGLANIGLSIDRLTVWYDIFLLKLGVVLLIIDWENLVLEYVKMFGGFGLVPLHFCISLYLLRYIYFEVVALCYTSFWKKIKQ
jgi:hypothetical protein